MSRREVLLRWVVGTLAMAGWIALCWLLGDAGGPLLAMPPLLAVGATLIAGMAGVLGTVVVAGLTVGNLIAIGSTVYGVYAAKKAQRQAARDAVNAFNAGLQDRMTTMMDAEAPWQSIYGEPWVAPVMVAATLTSGDRDQYKHVLYVWACHECQSIGEVTLRGVPIGALDAAGWVVGGAFMTGERITNEVVVTLDANARGVLPPEAGAWQGLVGLGPGPGEAQVLAPLAGNLATLAGGAVQVLAPNVAAWAGRTVRVTGYRDTGTPRLRVRHFLGSPDQTADPVLMAECPGEWTAADRGRGICYSVVTYDLNLPEFQNGPLEIKARIKGKRLLDHRTGVTAWSACNALVASDYLRSEQGKAAHVEHLLLATFNRGANACDEVVPYVLQYPNGALENRSAPRFTFHGAIRSDADPDQVLDLIAQSMGGTITRTAGLWSLQAGVYSEPVMTLNPEDRMGPLEAVEGEEGRAVFNALRGKFYDPGRFGERTDFPPYRNSAFAAEDGSVIWDDIDLPFTDEIWRCWYLCRLHTESNRGESLVYPAKRRARKLQPGDRVTINEPAWNITGVVYRVLKREWRLGGPVMLYLQQDAPEVWDQLDARHSLPPSAGVQPSPWVVLPVDGLDLVSGNSTLVLHQDGSVSARLKVTWNLPDDVYVTKGGELQIQSRELGASTWLPAAPGSPGAGVAYVDNLPEGKVYEVRVRFVNSLLAESPWRSRLVLHAGKFAAPSTPVWVSLSAGAGVLRGVIQRNPDLDRALPEFRYGASFATSQPIPAASDETGFVWPWPPAGVITIWAVHRDRSGGASPAQPRSITITAEQLRLGANEVDIALSLGAMNRDPGIASASNWEIPAGVGINAGPSGAAGAVGLRYFECFSGVDRIVWDLARYPLDDAAVYSFTANLYANPGNNRNMYLIVDMFDAAGARVPAGWGGSYSGYTFGGQPAPGAWQRCGADFGAGTPRPIPSNVVSCRIGVWFQYGDGSSSVQQAAQDIRLVDVTAARAAAKTADWTGVGGRPKSFVVRAQGYAATSLPAGWWIGLRNAETNAELYGVRRSYALYEIDRSGNEVFKRVYDVFGNGEVDGHTSATLAGDLNYICDTRRGNFVVVYSHDEPQSNRLNSGLPNAMYRCGASRAVFGSSQFRFRGAYILVGVAGSGEGMGAEVYAGAVDNDPNAWCELGFQIQGGVLTVSGANGGARSLFDLGPVQTENLAAGAATGIHAVRVAGNTAITEIAFTPPNYGSYTRAAFLTLVPSPADGGLVDVLVTASFSWEFNANNAPLGSDLCTALLGNAAVFDGFARQDVTGQIPAGASRVGTFVATKRFSVPAAQAVTFGVYGQTVFGSTCIWKDIELRAEVIKR